MVKILLLLSLTFYQHNVHVLGFLISLQPMKKTVRASSTAMFGKSTHLKYLEGKTLLSVQECIKVHNAMKSNAIEKSGDGPRAVFLDASWWHKGDLDGRKMYVT